MNKVTNPRKMSNLVFCRSCLSYNVRMYPISKTQYREIYEKQTGCKLISRDGSPDTLCYLCNSLLLRFCRFFKMTEISEKYLLELHRNGIELTPANVVLLDRVHNFSMTSMQRSSITDRVEDLPHVEVASKDHDNYEQIQDVDVKIESLDDDVQIVYEDTEDLTQSDISSNDNTFAITPVHEMFDTESNEGIVIEVPPSTANQTKEQTNKHMSQGSLGPDTSDSIEIEVQTNKQTNNTNQYILPNVSVALERIPIVTRSQHKRAKNTNTTDLFYYCEKCSYRCFYKDVLKKHLKMHDQKRAYTCKICSYRFRTDNGLANHKHSVHKNHLKCCICEKLFKKALYLQRHMRLHTGTQPYLCDFCNRKFNHRSTYTVHLRTHTGEKPFGCRWCSKTFNDKSNCRKHMKTHTGELYACYLCDKTYSLKSHLKQHVVEHIL